MKKTALLVLFLSFAIPATAGIGDPNTGPNGPGRSAPPASTPTPLTADDLSLVRVHDNVVLSKAEIFNRSLEWLAKNFTDSKAVVEIKDLENGKIVGKGITEVRSGIAFFDCRFTLTIDIKDGRYRTTYDTFTAMSAEYGNNAVRHKPMLERIKKENLIPMDEKLDAAIRQTKSDTW